MVSLDHVTGGIYPIKLKEIRVYSYGRSGKNIFSRRYVEQKVARDNREWIWNVSKEDAMGRVHVHKNIFVDPRVIDNIAVKCSSNL